MGKGAFHKRVIGADSKIQLTTFNQQRIS